MRAWFVKRITVSHRRSPDGMHEAHLMIAMGQTRTF